MSQIMTIGRFSFLLLIGLAVFAGCGSTPNDKATAIPHTAGWLPAAHATDARASIDACKECHGNDLAGGISGKGCTGCHMGGPTSMHPVDWSASILTTHGKYVVANGSSSCRNAYCHGPNLQGVADSGPSCSSCHNYP
jgi:hypothetical protein